MARPNRLNTFIPIHGYPRNKLEFLAHLLAILSEAKNFNTGSFQFFKKRYGTDNVKEILVKILSSKNIMKELKLVSAARIEVVFEILFYQLKDNQW